MATNEGNVQVRRLVTWQHEDTGYVFTKEIPAGECTPNFFRRFVVKEEPLCDLLTCGWEEDEMGGVFDTKCGNRFEFIDGGPEENGMKYCPYCGKVLVAHYFLP
jgi:hypothetical protein